MSGETAFQYLSLGGPSSQDWMGIDSDKFRHGSRKHYDSKDMLKTIEGVDLPFLGRKHFDSTYGTVKKSKLCLRPFPQQNRESTPIDTMPKPKKEMNYTAKPYGHPEKLHLYQGRALESLYTPTIKTFPSRDGMSNEANLERGMGRKLKIDDIDDKRNELGLKSLGDKAYKFPEYCDRFFKEGGLIAGSSIRARQVKTLVVKASDQVQNRPKGTTWKEKCRKDELDEEEAAVKSLFAWEQTSLKEGNPKWRDPDAAELEEAEKAKAAKEVKVDPKNAKKPVGKK
jgi:hypothetical protein